MYSQIQNAPDHKLPPCKYRMKVRIYFKKIKNKYNLINMWVAVMLDKKRAVLCLQPKQKQPWLQKGQVYLVSHQAIQSIRRESKLKVQLQVTLFLHLNFMWENLGHLNSKFRSGHGQEREHVGFQLQIHREKVGTYSILVILTRYGHQIHCQCRCTSYPPTHIFIGCVCVCVYVCVRPICIP